MPNRRTDRHRALTSLADSPEGYTDAIMLAHGFTPKLISDLVDAGLVLAQVDYMQSGGRVIDVTRILITGAGRRALTEGR
jgi:hypothetical protein